MSADPNNKTSNEATSFEQVLERLQKVVDDLEGGDLPLDRALAVFEEGVRLSRLGSQRLDEIERRVELLLESGDQIETRPFDEQAEGVD